MIPQNVREKPLSKPNHHGNHDSLALWRRRTFLESQCRYRFVHTNQCCIFLACPASCSPFSVSGSTGKALRGLFCFFFIDSLTPPPCALDLRVEDIGFCGIFWE
ncbi:hypothetical protein RJT34_32580 [Clitoria ternatea]|uniref:Uncharacterized protein n=1 Tax=Clitoria ternatea TaxID=43366 RepID=A0AAN9EX84_CLITE